MTRRTSLACALTFSLFTGTSSASTLLVQSDPNGLAFSSSFTSAVSGFYELLNTGTDIDGTIYSPPNPGFYGRVLWVAGQTVGVDGAIAGGDNDTDLTDGVKSYAEYTVRFTAEGAYRVFWSGQRTAAPQDVAEGTTAGNNDSLWIGGLNQDHTATAGWTQLTIGAGAVSYRSTGALWVINGANVNTDLTFTVGIREDGPIYDRIAFVKEDTGVAPDDLVTIPEPSGLVQGIAAAGLAAICGMCRIRCS
jgi:hypothetical protein